MASAPVGRRAARVHGGLVGLIALVALAGLLVASFAHAHTIGLSTGDYAAHGTTVDATWTFARADALRLLPRLDADDDGHLSAAELARADALGLLARGVVDRVAVSVNGPSSTSAICPGTLSSAGLVEEDGLVVRARYDCPHAGSTVAIDARILGDLGTDHRQLAQGSGATRSEATLDAAHAVFVLVPSAAVATEPVSQPPRPREGSPARASFLRYVALGVEHILTGYDHLAFLLGLLLVRARLRDLAWIVTAFTLGHSLSLALAATGLVVPSARFVEPAIALSIVYVGLDARFGFGAGARGRWKITLPFGLVHGFGFASALTELGLRRAAVPRALVGFNLGVEAGQLAVVALLVPLLGGLRRSPRFETTVSPLLAWGLVVAGAAWFVLRVASP